MKNPLRIKKTKASQQIRKRDPYYASWFLSTMIETKKHSKEASKKERRKLE